MAIQYKETIDNAIPVRINSKEPCQYQLQGCCGSSDFANSGVLGDFEFFKIRFRNIPDQFPPPTICTSD